MSRTIHGCAVLLVLVTVGVGSVPRAGGASLDYVPGQVLIKYRANTSKASQSDALRRLGGRSLLRLLPTDWELVALPLSLTVEEALSTYRGEALIERVQPDYVYWDSGLGVPTDADFPKQWHLRNEGLDGCTEGADIDAIGGWEFISAAPSVIVGVIDTGVDCSHPDIAPNVWTNPGEIPYDNIDNDGNGFIDDVHGYDSQNADADPTSNDWVHGTTVAGILGARGNNEIGIAGVCWDVQMMAVKILNKCGGNPGSRIAAGILYAVNNGAKITSNSWHQRWTYDGAIHDAIAEACAAGQLFVAAAGNFAENNDVTHLYPASYDLPCIISVAMTDCQDRLPGVDGAPACSATGAVTSYGAVSVDLAAPGCSIWTTTANLSSLPVEYLYAEGSGTSAAAPQVAGAAALLWEQRPAWPADSVKARLLATVDTLPSLLGKVASGGRLNLRRALDNVAPAAVVNLSVEMGRTTAKVEWTAPGDNGQVGTAWDYDLRMSQSPIDEGSFESASRVVTRAPSTAGTTECVTVVGLPRCANIYFALKTKDDAKNTSPLSNLALGYRCDNQYDEVGCGP